MNVTTRYNDGQQVTQSVDNVDQLVTPPPRETRLIGDVTISRQALYDYQRAARRATNQRSELRRLNHNIEAMSDRLSKSREDRTLLKIKVARLEAELSIWKASHT